MSSTPGGSYQGHEIAGVLATNTSRNPCTLRGYFFAQLQSRGRTLGAPAANEQGTVRTLVLRPGGTAEAQLTANVSNCQARVSDHVLVRAPGSSTATSVAIELRGCALSVSPVQSA